MEICEMCGKKSEKEYKVHNVYTEAVIKMELCEHCWDTHTCACGITVSDKDYLGDDCCPYCDNEEED